MKQTQPSDPKNRRTCRNCNTAISEAQALKTFQEFDTQMCPHCAAVWDQRILNGHLADEPAPEALDPETYRLYSDKDPRGPIYEAPQGTPTPPGAVPIGYHRPHKGGPSFELFLFTLKAPQEAGTAHKPGPQADHLKPGTQQPGESPVLDPTAAAQLEAHGFKYTEEPAAKKRSRTTGKKPKSTGPDTQANTPLHHEAGRPSL